MVVIGAIYEFSFKIIPSQYEQLGVLCNTCAGMLPHPSTAYLHISQYLPTAHDIDVTFLVIWLDEPQPLKRVTTLLLHQSLLQAELAAFHYVNIIDFVTLSIEHMTNIHFFLLNVVDQTFEARAIQIAE